MTDRQRTVFFLYGLGPSAASAAPLIVALSKRIQVFGIDLRGSGCAPDVSNGSVDAMANAVLATIKT